MRGFSSAVLSLAAMTLSSLTTYLTFFDSRYTLTQAVADVTVSQQGGGYSSGDRREVTYRFFPQVDLILSNRGTRPIVVSDMEIFESASSEACEETDKTLFMQEFEPIIVEPGRLVQTAVDTSLENIDGESIGGAPIVLEPVSNLYCLKWTLFDPNGRRHEPIAKVFSIDIGFLPPEPGEYSPETDVTLDFPKQPERLLSRGLF
ncbi:MAG: hypothetical protein AAFV54_00535 [Pseudomonadota bacterium]